MRAMYVIPQQAPPRLKEPNKLGSFNGFVQKCLTKDYHDRPSAEDLLLTDFLTAPGFKDIFQIFFIKAMKKYIHN